MIIGIYVGVLLHQDLMLRSFRKKKIGLDESIMFMEKAFVLVTLQWRIVLNQHFYHIITVFMKLTRHCYYVVEDALILTLNKENLSIEMYCLAMCCVRT